MDLEQYLLSKSACGADCGCGCSGKVDPDTLKMYGQKAATQFVGERVPMNDSIAQMAKEANLNHEQVKRVVEHANNLAFSQMFKAGFSQNITFPMADTSVVMQNLEAPMQVKQASVDIVKGSRYVPGQERVSLEAAFGYNSVTRAIEKTAAPVIDRHDLTRQYLDKVGSVQKMRSDMEIVADSFELESAALDRLIKQAQTEGYSPEVIGSCVDAANPSGVILNYLTDRYGSAISVGSIHKLAQMGVEMVSNPITDSVTILQNMQEQLFQLNTSIEQAQQQVSLMLQTMQQPQQPNPTSRLFSANNGPGLPQPTPEAPQTTVPQPQDQAPLESY